MEVKDKEEEGEGDREDIVIQDSETESEEEYIQENENKEIPISGFFFCKVPPRINFVSSKTVENESKKRKAIFSEKHKARSGIDGSSKKKKMV